jgi:exopolysaccharide biosynthesis polyprenyl glycosylphosphotransferase
MLQRDRQIRTQVQQILDACLFAFGLWLAFVLRSNEGITQTINQFLALIFPTARLDSVSMAAFETMKLYYLALVPAVPLVLESQGFYNRPVIGARWRCIWSLLRSCFIITTGLVVLLYLFNEMVPRGVMVYFGVICLVLVWAKEEILRMVLLSGMANTRYRRRIILAGIPAETARLRRAFVVRHQGEVEVVAEFNLASKPMHELIELIHEHSVSGVLVSARHTHFESVENVIKLCELEGVEAWLVADFFATQIARASFDELVGHPLIVFRSAPEVSWQMLLKQLIDFFGALGLLILGSIIMIPVALLVRLSSPGPVLFRQQRSGLNGAPFTIYKFRTMTSNAEQLKQELAAMNEMSGPVFKITNDPRITPIGKWLRKWSLDELPQLFNVLRGEMSLVGPRPLPVDEVKHFNDLAHRRRLSVKPGLTCIWQVQGRNKITDFKEWVRLDLEYIDTWSIWLDFKILLQTIPAVLRGTGAK